MIGKNYKDFTIHDVFDAFKYFIFTFSQTLKKDTNKTYVTEKWLTKLRKNLLFLNDYFVIR